MSEEINLLENYPKSNREISLRASKKTNEVRKIAREFGKEFFDGDRNYGYGGFNYNEKFWNPVIPTFQKYWNLNSNNSILDIGCAKGFMLFDIAKNVPGIKVSGIDISDYAIANSLPEMKDFLVVGDAKQLPYPDKSFDIVISINTIHNLEKEDCAKALLEINRVSKKASFVTVDAYRNDVEKKRMIDWNLTAKTIMSVDGWKNFFQEVGYEGDYYWFIP